MYKLSNQQFQEILSLFLVASKWFHCNEIVNEEIVKVKLLKNIHFFYFFRAVSETWSRFSWSSADLGTESF
jgi:hypothetical protein